MRMRTRIISLAWAVALVGALCCAPAARGQQTSASLTPEQEFVAAIRHGETAKVRALLQQNPALVKASNERGITAVLMSVYAEQPEITKLLLASGMELNIFEAAATGNIERVRALLKENPALIKAYSADGWTALHLNFGHMEIAELLLNSGADVNAVSKNKFVATPLQGAVVRKRLDLAQLLLAHGAKVNVRGEGGDSPLHEAAGSGQIEFAKLLLEHGADVNAKDDAGKTPLTIALEYKQPELAQFLRAHGAVQ